MPVTYLPQDLGGGLKYLDSSSGKATLYEVMVAAITQLNDQLAQFNQLRTDQLAAAAVLNNVVIDGGVVGAPTTPSTQITGTGDTTWNVDVTEVRAKVNDVEDTIAVAADTAVHSGSKLFDNGESCYAWLVVTESGGSLSLTPVVGTPATTGSQVAPTDAEITTAVSSANWAKLALGILNRTGDTTVTQFEDNTGRSLLANQPDTTATAVTQLVGLE